MGLKVIYKLVEEKVTNDGRVVVPTLKTLILMALLSSSVAGTVIVSYELSAKT